MGILKNIKDKFFGSKNFSSNENQAIKNSGFQLTQNLIFKFGSLLFTIVIARMLLPELMGLYSLALSTIVLFSAFSDLGIGAALFVFVAKLTGKGREEKAKGYFKKLLRWKITLLTIVSLVLLLSSFFIAEFYYNKPIFYALLVGALYIPAVGILGFLETIFKAVGDFKHPLFKEIVFQVLRFTIIPLGIFFLLKTDLSSKIIISLILLALILCYICTTIILKIMIKKHVGFLRGKAKNLNQKEKTNLKKFIFPLTLTALSGVFFGYIDTIMLGHFVKEQFIAFYGVAFSLISSAASIIGFSSIALFPIFSKLNGKPLEKIFGKTKILVFSISLLAGIFTYFLAYYIIRFTYGPAYLTAVPFLKLFAILIVFLPITSLYDNYFISQGKTMILAKLIILTTIINIILNIFFITYGLRFGMFEAVLGACFATIASRLIYFGGVIWLKAK
jgi:stage V sporulation protein B